MLGERPSVSHFRYQASSVSDPSLSSRVGAQRGPDALVDLGPVLGNRRGSAGGLDLFEPFVQELANGGPGPFEPARLHVGYEAGQRLDGCTLRALKGPGDLDGSAGGRIGSGEGPELPLA